MYFVLAAHVEACMHWLCVLPRLNLDLSLHCKQQACNPTHLLVIDADKSDDAITNLWNVHDCQESASFVHKLSLSIIFRCQLATKLQAQPVPAI